MKGKSKGWGKEKIISAIVACAVILTLSAGCEREQACQ